MKQNNKLIFPAGKISSKTLKVIERELKEYVQINKRLGPFERHKPHLLIPSIYNLSSNQEVLNKVRAYLKKDFFMWYSVFFMKSQSSEDYIPWHYDDYFWSITGNNGCTLWLAISDVTEDMGPMEFCLDPIGDFTHQTETNENNMLSRGNVSNFSPSKNSIIEKVYLNKGEFSIHSNKVWHRSGANKSQKDRVAIALRFITNDAHPTRLSFIKRGAVGRNFEKKFFYLEKKPSKVSKPLKTISHLNSIIIALFISAFGDKKRSLLRQITDTIRFIFSYKGLKLLLGIFISNNKKNGVSKINDG